MKGLPTESLIKPALYNKLDTYWLNRLNQGFGDVKQKSFKELVVKITEILRFVALRVTARLNSSA